MVWDDAPPWRLLVQIRRDERSASYKIDAKIVGDGNKTMSAATPLLLVPGLVFLKDRVARFDDCGAFEWVNVLRQYGTRQSRVESFQNDPDCRIFLISLKAGGLGLNLTAAEYVFLLDPWSVADPVKVARIPE